MTRQLEHRKRRRARGLCGYEGCKVVTGDTYHCPKHAKEQAVRLKRLRAAAKEARAA